jgi:hypothetical protein
MVDREYYWLLSGDLTLPEKGGALVEYQQIILLIINILGGVAVIGSYILGLKGQPSGVNILWGGVPANLRPVYTVSMILSALGYFAFIYFILFRLIPGEVDIGGRVGFTILFAIFLVILIASAFWMPLTNMYVRNPANTTWIVIRTVLALVALGSISLCWALLSLKTTNHGIAYWLAVTGSGYFAFHTTVLDAILWAALFKH